MVPLMLAQLARTAAPYPVVVCVISFFIHQYIFSAIGAQFVAHQLVGQQGFEVFVQVEQVLSIFRESQ